jgi:hypothetical protein
LQIRSLQSLIRGGDELVVRGDGVFGGHGALCGFVGRQECATARCR